MSQRIRAAIGLGNVGEEYARTRHNIGFMVVEAVARRQNLQWKRERQVLGSVAKGCIGESEVLLLRPSTYMNESGRSVSRFLATYGVSVAELLVVADDADLPLGRLRLRSGGGTGGHNGLKSIRDALRTEEYVRLRVGIGRTAEELQEHVLGSFKAEELADLERCISRAALIVEETFSLPLQEVMNHANVKEDPKNDGKTNARATL